MRQGKNKASIVAVITWYMEGGASAVNALIIQLKNQQLSKSKNENRDSQLSVSGKGEKRREEGVQ